MGKLIGLYFKKSWVPWALIIGILAFICGDLAGLVLLNDWRGDFWTIIEQREGSQFLYYIGLFTAYACLSLICSTISYFLEQHLATSFRNFSTKKLHEQFNLFHEDHNPDQRLTEDIRHYCVEGVWMIAYGVFNLLRVIVFLGVLASLSTIFFDAFWILPGLAIVIAIVGTFLTSVFGMRLIKALYAVKTKEANYRKSLLLFGNSITGLPLLSALIQSVRIAIKQQTWIMGWTGLYIQLSIIIPILLLAPVYMASTAIAFGALMQAINAWSEIDTGILYIVNNYSRIAEWKTASNRLRDLLNSKK